MSRTFSGQTVEDVHLAFGALSILSRCMQVLNRVNVFNGNKYSEEPAIFAWDILNEPRDPQNQVAPGEIRFPRVCICGSEKRTGITAESLVECAMSRRGALQCQLIHHCRQREAQ